MIASIVGWLLGHVLNLASGGVVQKAIDIFNKINGTEVDTTTKGLETIVAVKKIEAEENQTKWQLPWFGIVACILVGPVVLYFWTITLYDIFWWEYGLWPQTYRLSTGDMVGWKIAAYPGILQDWATSAFQWVFAPALGVGAILKVLGKK